MDAVLEIIFKKSYHKKGKRKGKLLPKNDEISEGKAYTNTWKLISYTRSQGRVNACKHTVEMAPREFLKSATRGVAYISAINWMNFSQDRDMWRYFVMCH